MLAWPSLSFYFFIAETQFFPLSSCSQVRFAERSRCVSVSLSQRPPPLSVCPCGYLDGGESWKTDIKQGIVKAKVCVHVHFSSLRWHPPNKVLQRWLAASPLPLVCIRSVTSGTIIHHVTGLSYPGWLISILFAATSHFPHTPISICIGNGGKKLLCPRRHLISSRPGKLFAHKSAQRWRICPLTGFLFESNISSCHYLLSVMCWSNVSHLRLGWRTCWRCFNFTHSPTPSNKNTICMTF